MSDIETVIARKLGGKRVLGRTVRSAADIERLVRAGLPVAAFKVIEDSRRFSARELSAVIPARTLRHRGERRQPLNQEESDRAVRLLRVQTLAEQTLGNDEKADKWLRRPLAALDGEKPIGLATTEAGARVVESLLEKIAWGAAA